jgi:hypothetical protein
MQTFPEAPFRLNNWTAHGYQCVLDKTPDRILDIQARPWPPNPTPSLPGQPQDRAVTALNCSASIPSAKSESGGDAHTAWRQSSWGDLKVPMLQVRACHD